MIPTAVELKVVVAVANTNLAQLVQQQVEAKDQEEKESRDWAPEAREAKVGTS